mmetsp:Transcript_73774/g.127969  ORF Transcript_73774/g.127969 Transcript_73774/m.127969 type:complete len:193 (-) Transcript_73774:31-609(-)
MGSSSSKSIPAMGSSSSKSQECTCEQGEMCPIFQAMKEYKFSKTNYHHCVACTHPKTPCRYGVECHAHQRLLNNGHRFDDICHHTVYYHSRAKELGPQNSTCFPLESTGGSLGARFNGGAWTCNEEAHALTSFGSLSFEAALATVGIKEKEDVAEVVKEIQANGFGYVLEVPEGGGGLGRHCSCQAIGASLP